MKGNIITQNSHIKKLQSYMRLRECKKLISPNCTPSNQKFRLLFKLPFILCEGELVTEIRKSLNYIYNGDKATIDPCRLFYGNNNNFIVGNLTDYNQFEIAKGCLINMELMWI